MSYVDLIIYICRHNVYGVQKNYTPTGILIFKKALSLSFPSTRFIETKSTYLNVLYFCIEQEF